jgi:hypothetical protein
VLNVSESTKNKEIRPPLNASRTFKGYTTKMAAKPGARRPGLADRIELCYGRNNTNNPGSKAHQFRILRLLLCLIMHQCPGFPIQAQDKILNGTSMSGLSIGPTIESIGLVTLQHFHGMEHEYRRPKG